MSPLKPFANDAFISYSSPDRAWAEQFAQSLTGRGFKVFFDRDSLRVGETWEGQLDENLDSSQHLVVLWSANASRSDWVKYERTYFHLKTRGSALDPNRVTRRQVIVLLDDTTPAVHSSLQMIPTLREAKVYPDGLATLDSNVWQNLIRQIEDSIRDNSNSTRILVAVLASTRDSLDTFDFDKSIGFVGSMGSVMDSIGIDKTHFMKCYGAKPAEWRPFGGSDQVWTILENLKTQILQATNGTIQIQWIPIGEDFWSTDDLDAAEREARRLVSELSLIVIDPLSLCNEQVSERINLIQGCFTNTNSVVMVLSPCSAEKSLTPLRNLVKVRARPVYNSFYQPPVPLSSPFANFGVNLVDHIDMQRLILTTLGQYVTRTNPPARNTFTNP
ncbi:MAG: toll/interleukin-1 receptor domain-containing protein [Pyrinomonadaceae bacterium MAG19_C2-C3]|nr:toll/interleukin-1 receptor domain-containing protein [Pyrinomonadaceae bacterium MAG19_C2-C3]